MIKDEVKLTGLRKISAKHLRNSCILDHVQSDQDDKEVLRYFHLTHPYSLHRISITKIIYRTGNKTQPTFNCVFL